MNQFKTIHRNPIMELGMLLLLLLVFNLMGALLTQLLVSLSGIDLQVALADVRGENSLASRNFLRVTSIFGQLANFGLPALVFVCLFYKEQVVRFLQVQHWPRIELIFGGILLLIMSVPFVQWLFMLNRLAPLPDWATQLEGELAELMLGLLRMDGVGELLLNLVTIALVPAICEELFFRGVLQRKLADYSGRAVLAIWVSATIFSAIHGQFEGFLPRLFLGVALGYMLLWTGNLWVPICAHFANNALQLIGAYIYSDRMEEMLQAGDETQIPIWIAGVSFIFALGIGYAMRISANYPQNE